MTRVYNDNPNEASSESQKKRILKYLEEGETITAMEALVLFQCFRLASRMTDLKNDEVQFESVMVKTPSNKRVKAYYIPEKFAGHVKLPIDGKLKSYAALYAESKIGRM